MPCFSALASWFMRQMSMVRNCISDSSLLISGCFRCLLVHSAAFVALSCLCSEKGMQRSCKPGSVPARRTTACDAGACHLSSPRVTPRLKRSTLHCILGGTRADNPRSMVYMNLQPPVGTARRSPAGWWSLTPPSHPYSLKRSGCFLLP